MTYNIYNTIFYLCITLFINYYFFLLSCMHPLCIVFIKTSGREQYRLTALLFGCLIHIFIIICFKLTFLGTPIQKEDFKHFYT